MKSSISGRGRCTSGLRYFVSVRGFAGLSRVATGLEQLGVLKC